LGPLLALAKCDPPKFSWITAILKSENKVSTKGNRIADFNI